MLWFFLFRSICRFSILRVGIGRGLSGASGEGGLSRENDRNGRNGGSVLCAKDGLVELSAIFVAVLDAFPRLWLKTSGDGGFELGWDRVSHAYEHLRSRQGTSTASPNLMTVEFWVVRTASCRCERVVNWM